MNTEDIGIILKDQQDILVRMNERLHSIEEQKVEQDRSADHIEGLKDAVKEYIAIGNTALKIIAQQRQAQTQLLEDIPSKINVEVQHSITGKQRPFVIAGLVLLFLACLSFFMSIRLWKENNVLQDSDIKLRMVRLQEPDLFLVVDSVYRSNPKALRAWVKQEEERLVAIRKAEETIQQYKEQSEQAREKAERLRGRY